MIMAITTQPMETAIVMANTVIHMADPSCPIGPNAPKRIWFHLAVQGLKPLVKMDHP